MKEYYKTENGILYYGDCLEIMNQLNFKVDAIITDPPYGTTQCKWDVIIPFENMWNALNAITYSNTPIVLFGSEPFSSNLRLSNIGNFKYDWIWDKPKGTGFLNAKIQPMRNHEVISVFYKEQCLYNPQKTTGHIKKQSFRKSNLQSEVYGKTNEDYSYNSTERYPRSIQTFSSDTQSSSFHPTQKPLELLIYLVKTYSDEGDTILDFTSGSGTLAIACEITNRKWICIEKEQKYCDVTVERLQNIQQRLF